MSSIFLGVIAPSFVLAPLASSIANYRILNREFKVLTYFFVASLLANVINSVLTYSHISNLFIFHIYTPIEAILLFLFFEHIFSENRIRSVIRFLMIAFPVYCFINYLFFQNGKVFNTYTHPIETLIFIGLCTYYFWLQSINNTSEIKWTSVPINWVISGLLLYFSSTFFLYLFSNLLLERYDSSVNIYIWKIHGVMVLIMYILCAIGFYKCKK